MQFLFAYTISDCSTRFINAVKSNLKNYFLTPAYDFVEVESYNKYKRKCFEAVENFRDYIQEVEQDYASCEQVPDIMEKERKVLRTLELYCTFDNSFRKCNLKF